MKLGRRPARFNRARRLLFQIHFANLPPAPASAKWSQGVALRGQMLNNVLGDCTIAALGHAIQVSLQCHRPDADPLGDDVIQGAYSAWCGYVEGAPSTDNGGNETDVLNNFEKNGLRRHPGCLRRRRSTELRARETGYREPRWRLLGLDLPLTAQSQTVWDVVDEGPKTFWQSFSQSSLTGALGDRATGALGAAMRCSAPTMTALTLLARPLPASRGAAS